MIKLKSKFLKHFVITLIFLSLNVTSVLCFKDNLLNVPEEERLFKAGQIYFDKGLISNGLKVFDELMQKYPRTRFKEQILLLKYLKSYNPEYLIFKYKFVIYLIEKTILGTKNVPKEITIINKVLRELPDAMEVGLGNFSRLYPNSKLIPKFCYNLARYYLMAENEFAFDLSDYFNVRQISGIALKAKWDPFKRKWSKNKNKKAFKCKDYRKVYLDFFFKDKHKSNLIKAKKYYKKVVVNYPDSSFWEDAVKELAAVLEIIEESE
ncbi:tetratricopeptide repeat protein [bacterium]|nr:tetratricopeptide repeat protein [bacterium]